jgi:integrase/recombinase XerD
LLRAAESHPNPQTSIDPVTVRTMLLLLYGAGLRVSEAIHLDRRDVNLKESLLTIRQTKFGKTRLVPFGPDLGRALTQHARRASIASGPFFTTRNGARVNHDTLRHNFRLACDRAGIRRNDGGRFQPRLHDLRHTFAVHRMTSWYRQGADVQKLLPQLSTYLGHVRLKDTQVYIKMTPELLQAASQRFERYAGKEERHD